MTAVVAVIIALLGVVGSLAGNWGSRKALKEELEIAKQIHEIYPDHEWLQEKIADRISSRVGAISVWTPLLFTTRAMVVAGIGVPVVYGMKSLEIWLATQGVPTSVIDSLTFVRRLIAVIELILTLGILSLLAPSLWRNIFGRHGFRHTKPNETPVVEGDVSQSDAEGLAPTSETQEQPTK